MYIFSLGLLRNRKYGVLHLPRWQAALCENARRETLHFCDDFAARARAAVQLRGRVFIAFADKDRNYFDLTRR